MTDPKADAPDAVTEDWLRANGFARCNIFGYTRDLAVGPDDEKIWIAVGNSFCNVRGVSLYIGEYGCLTNATGLADLQALIRLFDKAHMDHPYSM